MDNQKIWSIVLNKIQVEEKDVVKSFVYGSRLFKVNKEDSDYDILVILNDFKGPLKNEASPEQGVYDQLVTIGEYQFDINVYHTDYWKYKINQNIIDAVASMTIPKENLLYDSGEKIDFKIHYMKLKYQVDVFKGVHEEIARKLIKKGNFLKAKKILIHCIRTLKFGTQVAQYGYIKDFYCANNEYKTIYELPDDEEIVKTWFYDQMYPLDNEFRKYVNKYKTYSPVNVLVTRESQYITKNTIIEEKEEVYQYEKDFKGVYLLKYLQEGGKLDNLERDLQLYVKSLGNELYQINIDSFFSPRQSFICEQSNGMIIDMKNQQLVAYPFDRFQPHDCVQVFELDWKTTKITEKLNGINTFIYFYNQQWNVDFFKGWSSLTNSFLSRYSKDDLSKLFWKEWKNLNYEYPKDESKTYMFNFIPKLKKSRIILVGARSLKDLKECDISSFSYELPKVISFTSLSKEPFVDLIKYCNQFDPLEYEGLIACDQYYHRVSFKSNHYNQLESLTRFTQLNQKLDFFFQVAIDTLSNQDLVDQFNFWYPQWKLYYDFYAKKILEICKKSDEIYQEIKSISDEKEFSKLCAKHKDLSTYLFFLRKNKKERTVDIINEKSITTKLQKMIFENK